MWTTLRVSLIWRCCTFGSAKIGFTGFVTVFAIQRIRRTTWYTISALLLRSGETRHSSLGLSSPLLPLGKMTCRCWTWGLSKVSFVNVLQIIGHNLCHTNSSGHLFSSIKIFQEIWVKGCGAIVLLLRKSSNLPSSCFSFEVAEMTCASQTWGAFSRNHFAQWFSEYDPRDSAYL